jgi:regulator of replication initiation timing
MDREGSSMRRMVEDLTMDKQRQRSEFMVMQAKALKMTSALKRLAANISTYLEENKLLRIQLERCDKRLHLGLQDMTPRPDYREIFRRREFKHFKDDFSLKIMQQEYTTADVVEQLIDVVKAYESKHHFTAGSNRVMPESLTNIRQSKDKKQGQAKPGLPRLVTQDSLMPTGGRQVSRVDSKRQIKVDGLSRNEDSTSNRSSRKVSLAGFGRGSSEMNQPRDSRSQRDVKARKSSDSEDCSSQSAASKLSDRDYQDIRTLEQGMDEMNKDFGRLVNI